MEIKVSLIERKGGKWDWKIEGGDVSAGGTAAKSKKAAEDEAKGFVLSLVEAEKFCLETDSVDIRVYKRRK